jgi:phosphoglycerol transferase
MGYISQQRIRKVTNLRLARDFIPWSLIIFVPVAIAVWSYRITPTSLTRPWSLHGDLVTAYAFARSKFHGIFGFTNPGFGAPFSADYRFENFDYLNSVIIVLFRMISGNPFFSVNFFFLLTFPLASIFFYVASRKLGTNQWLAVVLSIIYSTLPYHFYRFEQGHVSLSGYYLLPVGLLSIVNIIRSNHQVAYSDEPKTEFKFLKAFIVNVIVGSSVAYYSFFLLLCAGFVLGVKVLSPQRPKIGQLIKICSSLSGFILVPFSISLFAPRAAQPVSRSLEESLIWGGSLTRLLIPWSPFAPEFLKSVSAPVANELEWVGIGVVSWMGGLLLIAHTFIVSVDEKSKAFLRTLTTALVVSLLLYVSGGLGYVVALLITPNFRCWNRFSVVIETISLLGLGLILSIASLLKRYLRAGLWTLLLFGFVSQIISLDQLGVTQRPNAQTETEYSQLNEFSRVLEQSLKPDCSILQLPTMLYPEGGVVDDVPSGDHFRLGLLSPNFRWSYGASKFTEEGYFWLNQPAGEVSAAKDLGFCAVVIDTRSSIGDLSEFGKYVTEDSPLFDLLILQ